MWNDLLLNLASEAVGIAITVFFVDRIIAWREQRRWKQMQDMVWQASWQPATAIAGHWGEWLTAVASRGRRFQLSPQDSADLASRGLPPYNEALRLSLESAIGAPVGSRLIAFSDEAGEEAIRGIRGQLTTFLAANPLIAGDPAWAELTEMAKPVDRLFGLVGGFAGVVALDPEYAFPILRLSYDLDNLQLQEYQLDFLSARLPVATMLAESIEQSMLLCHYLRNRDAAHWLTQQVDAAGGA